MPKLEVAYRRVAVLVVHDPRADGELSNGLDKVALGVMWEPLMLKFLPVLVADDIDAIGPVEVFLFQPGAMEHVSKVVWQNNVGVEVEDPARASEVGDPQVNGSTLVERVAFVVHTGRRHADDAVALAHCLRFFVVGVGNDHEPIKLV